MGQKNPLSLKTKWIIVFFDNYKQIRYFLNAITVVTNLFEAENLLRFFYVLHIEIIHLEIEIKHLEAV